MLLDLIFCLGLAATSSAWTCYTPDGLDRNSGLNGSYYVPCDNTAKFSMCCRINDSSPGANGNDTCLPSGMCYNGASRETWRESCTDKTWRSESCAKLFVNGTSLDSATGISNPPFTDVLVTDCLDGTWCSGKDNTECCRQKKGVYLDKGSQTSARPSSSAIMSPATTLSISSTSAPSRAAENNGLSPGAKAGVGAGIGAGVLLILASIGFFCMRKRSRAKAAQAQQPPPAHWQETHEVANHFVRLQPQPGSSTKYAHGAYKAHEVGDSTQIFEVEGYRPGDRVP